MDAAGRGPCPRGPTAPRLHLAPGVPPRSRPSWGEPCRSGRPELQEGQSPLSPGSRESQPLQSRLQTRPLLPGPRAPRLLLATCVRALTTCHAPLSVPLLHPCGFRPGVRVSVCPCPCACGSWRCRGVHAGTEPAVGRQRPDRLTPGPLSPVIGAGVLRSGRAVCWLWSRCRLLGRGWTSAELLRKHLKLRMCLMPP